MPEAAVSAEGRDGLGQLLQRASRSKRLTAEEERDLARRVQEGDARAKERMIEANLLLVVSMAKRYRHPGMPLADLVQEGTIGLIRAVERFDPERGNRFSTYAVFWIRQYLVRALAEKSRLVRLPADANARLVRLQRRERDLQAEIGRIPTSAELADSLDMTRGDIEQLRQVAAPVASLDEPVGDDGAPLRDRLHDADSLDPADSVDVDDGSVHALLGQLSPRQREVIERRFGLAGHDATTPEAIAAALGVTRSRVHRLEREALDRLHRRLRPGTVRPTARLRALQESRRGGQDLVEAA